MTYLRGALVTLCLVAVSTVSFAQKDRTKEAHEYFNAHAYYGAIEAYKDAYVHEKKDSEKDFILYRVGECYRLIADPVQAEAWYQKAEAAEYKSAEFSLHYGDVLMKQGKYDEAIKKYREALGANPSSSVRALAEKGVRGCEEAVVKVDNPAKRYKVVNEVQLNSKYHDFSPYYGDKKLESMLFTSTRPSGEGGGEDIITGESFSDIFTSTRDPKGKWSTPTPLPAPLNSLANEGTPHMDSKYSNIYFTRCEVEKKEAKACQIWTSRSQGANWADPTLLDFGMDDTTVAGHPVAIDEELILFVSDLQGGYGGKDLWYIRYDKKSKQWGPPTNLGPEINTAGNEMFPYINYKGDLYFASDGHPGMGGLDIFVAEIKGSDLEAMKWGKPTNLWTPINSSGNDFAIIFEEDKDRGYFTSDRPGGKGKDDIYSFSLPPLIFKLEGVVTDFDTKEPLGNVKVKLLGTDGSVAEVMTDPTGHYEFETKEKSEERYIVENTSYTIEVSALENKASNDHRYLGSKGQETTVNLKESTLFKHDFQLICADCSIDIKMPLVLYELGKWDLMVNESINSKDSLNYLFDILTDNPTIVIELAAHTDTRGSNAANKTLSQKRAESCVKYLIERGIDPERMVPVGYGEDVPIVKDAEIAAMKTEAEREAAHQKNRRTVFKPISFDYIPKNPPANGTK